MEGIHSSEKKRGTNRGEKLFFKGEDPEREDVSTD